MGYEVSGVLGVIVLLLDVWAIMKIVGSDASTLTKFIWILIVLLLPVLGLIIWFFVGPKSA